MFQLILTSLEHISTVTMSFSGSTPKFLYLLEGSSWWYDEPVNRHKNFGVLPVDDVMNIETCRSEVQIS